jgi:tRNA (cytidine/uridine-2'-O-)-methyltransferase
MRLCLYQPDIAANVGSILRLGACLATPCEIIGPCGFPFDDTRLRRAGMDYIEQAEYRYHASWSTFHAWRSGLDRPARLVLLTTKGAETMPGFRFQPDDLLLFGRESAGVPEDVHAAADHRILVPMAPGARSLNLAMSAALVLGEALRQTEGWPGSSREA